MYAFLTGASSDVGSTSKRRQASAMSSGSVWRVHSTPRVILIARAMNSSLPITAEFNSSAWPGSQASSWRSSMNR